MLVLAWVFADPGCSSSGWFRYVLTIWSCVTDFSIICDVLNIYVNTVVVLVLLRIRILRFNSMRIAIRIQGANQCGSGQTLPSHLLEFFHENIFVFCIGGGVQQLDRWEGTTLFAWSAWCAWFRQWLLDYKLSFLLFVFVLVPLPKIRFRKFFTAIFLW